MKFTYYLAFQLLCLLPSARLLAQVPGISREPSNCSAPIGTSCPLSIVATGSGLTYQWYFGTSGNTSARSTTTDSNTATHLVRVSAKPAGRWVRVSNSFGYADSTEVFAQTSTVLPPTPTPAPATNTSSIPASLFGFTVKNSGMVPSSISNTARSWDTKPHPSWSDLSPSRGVYNWTNLDFFMADNGGRDLIYTLGRTPQWASSQPNAHTDYGPGQCAPPTNISDWDDYVTAIVTHSAGRVRYWELWNEPQNLKYYCGDMPTMVLLAEHAYQIIKRIDPGATVLSPSQTSYDGPKWMQSFLSSGGSKYVDVMAFHGYPAHVEHMEKIVGQYKAVMAANGVGNLPMWDTESSVGGTLQQSAEGLPKYYLLEWSAGVSRFLWYAYDDPMSTGKPLWTSAGGETVIGTAYDVTRVWMVGASLTGPCSSDTSGTWTCGLTRKGKAEVVVWNSMTSGTYNTTGFNSYMDISGVTHPVTNGQVTLSSAPVLLF